MRVYLVQHGKALSKAEHPDRPLSEQGTNEVRAMADFLRRDGCVQVTDILHSGKLRAAQTAELFGRRLDAVCREAPDLQPNDDPGLWSAHLAARAEDVMLVGHLPHLERLASLLLCGEPDRGVVRFHNAGVVCLARDEGGAWRLEWAITPELVMGALAEG